MPAEVLALPLLTERLPLPPSPSLDPLLDAAVECISRHGLSKTSLSDIAREMGVAPSTVSRKVGSVDNVALLVLGREAHRLLETVPVLLAGAEGPDVIIRVMVAAIEAATEHPMSRKVLQDEGQWMGRMVTRRLDDLIDQGVELSAPFLAAAMDAGAIRRQDPELLAHWLLRISLATVVSPPPGDLRSALDPLLLPLLTPDPEPSSPPTRKRQA